MHLGFAVVFILLVPEFAFAAEPSFPRGPGFYYSTFKLVVLIGVYLGWVATCNWVDRGCSSVGLTGSGWNSSSVGLGFAGLVLVWILSVFWLPLLLLVVCYVGSAFAYIH